MKDSITYWGSLFSSTLTPKHRSVVITLPSEGLGRRRVGVGAMPWPVKEIPFLHLLGLGETRKREGSGGGVSMDAAHEHVAYLRGELSPFRFIFA